MAAEYEGHQAVVDRLREAMELQRPGGGEHGDAARGPGGGKEKEDDEEGFADDYMQAEAYDDDDGGGPDEGPVY